MNMLLKHQKYRTKRSLRNYILDYMLDFANVKYLVALMKVSRRLFNLISKKDSYIKFKQGLIDLRRNNISIRPIYNKIDLIDLDLEDITILNLSEALKVISTVFHLSLFNCNLGHRIKFISEALYINFNIRILNLGDNKIGSDPTYFKYLTDAFKISTSLKCLYLYKNSIGCNSENIILLSEALKINSSIVEIDLTYNQIGSETEDMKLISEVIEVNTSIRELSLSDNLIGCRPSDVKYLTSALIANTTLRKLDIRSNRIGSYSRDSRMLLNAFEINKTLKRVDLRWNRSILKHVIPDDLRIYVK